jgi:hypothetical protein
MLRLLPFCTVVSCNVLLALCYSFGKS